MTWAFCCAVCETRKHRWRIDRLGDAQVSWACTTHLTAVMIDMQRVWEPTRLVVTRLHDVETGQELPKPEAPTSAPADLTPPGEWQ